MLSEKWWSYSISKIHLILKKFKTISKNNKERARENKDTADFYTGSPNSRATSVPYTQ